MKEDKEKSKKQLMTELAESRQRLVALEDKVSELNNVITDLQKSELKYRIVADNTFDWEFWLGPEADIIYSSPSAERITGYPAAEFLSDPMLLYRIVHPDDLSRVAESLNRKRVERGFCELEFRIRHRSGEERWIAIAFHGIYEDESGKYLGIRASNRDITAQKKETKRDDVAASDRLS